MYGVLQHLKLVERIDLLGMLLQHKPSGSAGTLPLNEIRSIFGDGNGEPVFSATHFMITADASNVSTTRDPDGFSASVFALRMPAGTRGSELVAI